MAAGGETVSGALTKEGSFGVNNVPLKPGDYVALYPSLWGSGTIMALSDNLALDVIAFKNGLHSAWRFQLPKRQFTAGEELRGEVLFVKGAYPEMTNNALAESLRTRMGFSGKPAYTIEPRRGEVLGTVYRLRAKAQDGVWSAALGKAQLPVLLPVEVSGLNGRWEAFCLDRRTKLIKPIPVCEGTGYACLDLSAGADVVIGHPVTCNQPEVRLNVLQTGQQWSRGRPQSDRQGAGSNSYW